MRWCFEIKIKINRWITRRNVSEGIIKCKVYRWIKIALWISTWFYRGEMNYYLIFFLVKNFWVRRGKILAADRKII